jgi:hypothetical protein
VSTHEPEITESVDLALPDGMHLNPAASGWSRRVLHTANLVGVWGRTKRWDYWAVLAGDLVVSSVYADVDYLGLADVWWCDMTTGTSGGRGITVPFARGIALPDLPGTAPLHARSRRLDLAITDDEAGTTRIEASWRERDGRRGALDVSIAIPAGHESMNVVIPWTDRRFQFTSKHQARPATGRLTVGDTSWEIGGASGDAWGVLDVGRGRWPYSTVWNWGGGAGRADDGTVVGIQIGGKWTEGTGATENGVILDGRLTKLGRELEWRYDWERPLEPWTVRDPAGALDLLLTPRYDKHSRTDIGILRTETHQVFGTWSGSVVDDEGRRVTFSGLQGFAEESRSRW